MSLLTIVLLAAASQPNRPEQATDRAALRIRQAQYCAAVEVRAQHREVELVQPVSRLEPELEAAQRRAAMDRLVMPEKLKEMRWRRDESAVWQARSERSNPQAALFCLTFSCACAIRRGLRLAEERSCHAAVRRNLPAQNTCILPLCQS